MQDLRVEKDFNTVVSVISKIASAIESGGRPGVKIVFLRMRRPPFKVLRHEKTRP
jgi:hypothetical protein